MRKKMHKFDYKQEIHFAMQPGHKYRTNLCTSAVFPGNDIGVLKIYLHLGPFKRYVTQNSRNFDHPPSYVTLLTIFQYNKDEAVTLY